MSDLDEYLEPTKTIDCDNELILAKAHELTLGCTSLREKAVKLFLLSATPSPTTSS